MGIKLARLETKVDQLLSEAHDHETRIRAVERKVWTFSGVAAVLGAAGAAVMEHFGRTA